MAQTARRAPGFSLPDAKLQQHDLYDARGKVVLLDIVRTDCPKCMALTRELAKVKEKYGDKVQILSIVTPPDNMTTVTGFIKNENVTWPVLFDCGQVSASYAELRPDNPNLPLPQLFVVDQAGMIKLRVRGDGNPADLGANFWQPTVDALLKNTKK